jgi:ATP-dependent helicase HepA
MTPHKFAVGQRWISSSQPELGLGVVVELDGRSISIQFPAADEDRRYAVDTAPLSRVIYREGDVVTDGNNSEFVVMAASEKDGCVSYEVLDAEGQRRQLPEVLLNSAVSLSSPRDRILSGQLDRPRRFALRQQTLAHQARLHQSPVQGLLGARVQLLPHQFYIASEVANRYAPRVLLADEVGLGKTIEAGLIIHQQLSTGLASRVMVVVPDSLVHQWMVEMLRRFNLAFTLLDEDRCEGFEEDENPFDSCQLVLCSQSFITNDFPRFAQALDAQWDLLVVDEAHHLEWKNGEPSPAYQHIEALANEALGLLLLTATPEQLGMEGHFARLRLLDPERYHSLEKFVEEQASYQPVSDLVQLIQTENGWATVKSTPQALESIVGEERSAAMVAEDDAQAVIRELLDQHGIGRVFFRNTRKSVDGFNPRELHSYPLTAPDVYAEAVDFGGVDLQHAIQSEILIGEDWLEEDPRVEWLVKFLQDKTEKASRKKVLVIAASSNVAQGLEKFLSLRHGLRATAFHEGMSLIERDRAAAWFADLEDGAQVMLCSEIGSEGRNFQFAQHLVLFDLPLHPDLLEQRIGRLDRIGQTGTINIHVPHYQDSPQEGLLNWYNQGLDAFSRPFPAGESIMQVHGHELHDALSDGLPLDEIIEHTAGTVKEQLAALHDGRDVLVELNSCDAEKAHALLEAVEETEQADVLNSFMESVFEQFGVTHEPHSEHAFIAKQGDEQEDQFPGVPEDGVTATTDRQTALQREDMQYVSWEHPMVAGAFDMILNTDFGNATFCTLKVKGIEPGTLMVETVHKLTAVGPSALRLPHYLPASPVRRCLDSLDRDLSKHIPPAQLDKHTKSVPVTQAVTLVQHARSKIEQIIDKAQRLADKQADDLVAEATAKAQALLGGEHQRLVQLSKVNPSIRASEIKTAALILKATISHLEDANMILDAVRVVLVVDK